MQSPIPARRIINNGLMEYDEQRGNITSSSLLGNLTQRSSSIEALHRSFPIDPNEKSLKSQSSKSNKDLSHVPCKFFKQGACSNGKSCPFSHELVAGSGAPKPVCQWYAKGNCKFGHKCALAHILPGQPLSWDRKNKRAAQAALREAGGLGENGILAPSSPSGVARLLPPSASGIGRSLMGSSDLDGNDIWDFGNHGQFGTPPRAALSPHFSPIVGQQSPRTTPLEQDLAFGFPDDFDVGPDPPVLSYRDNYERSSPVLGSSSLFGIAPGLPSGLSQTLHQTHLTGSPRSTIAAHAMLSDQQRRLSSSNRESSPSRLQQLQHSTGSRRSFGSTELLGGSTVPLAVPTTSNSIAFGASSSPSLFGTSPFSGSRSLFLPSSYDSDTDGFPRSPTIKRSTLAEETRGRGGFELNSRNFKGVFDDEEGDDDDGFTDEGFLPSSLNDLLTPEEQRRRSVKTSIGNFDPFFPKSMPAEFNTGADYKTHSPPLVPRSLLSTKVTNSNSNGIDHSLLTSPSLHNQILTRNTSLFSSSFDPTSNFGIRYSGQEFSPKASPRTLAKVLNEGEIGGSLPKGMMAAGLSSLHLIPAIHSGETPPTSQQGWGDGGREERKREATIKPTSQSLAPGTSNEREEEEVIQFDMED